MRKSRRANIDAMLRHLASHHDPQDFPSTAFERQALIEAAGKRRLIEWQKERRRYELTPIGVRRLKRGGGLGLPALAISAGIGAAIGAVALAMLWLPADPAGSHAALGPPGENIGAPVPAADAAPAAPPVTTANVVPQVPAEPAKFSEPPAAPPPDAETVPAARESAGKKSRHRSTRSSGHRNWNFGRRYQDERFAGSGR